MELLNIIFAVFMLMVTVSAAPAPSTESLDKRDGYALRCNKNNLSAEGRKGNIDALIGRSGREGRGAMAIDVSGSKGSKMPCRSKDGAACGKVRVSVRLLEPKGAVLSMSIWAENILRGVEAIDKTCGSKGGSVGVPGVPGDGAVVHMTEDWV